MKSLPKVLPKAEKFALHTIAGRTRILKVNTKNYERSKSAFVEVHKADITDDVFRSFITKSCKCFSDMFP